MCGGLRKRYGLLLWLWMALMMVTERSGLEINVNGLGKRFRVFGMIFAQIIEALQHPAGFLK